MAQYGTMMKTPIVRWWYNDSTMVKTRCYDGENTMVQWWNCDSMMMKTRYYFHHRVIASVFHHRAVVFSSSYFRTFIIVPSCIAIQGKKMLLLSKRNTVIGRYLNDTIAWLVLHLAGKSCLASHIASCTSTRDKKILRGRIPLNSIPFMFYIKLTFFKELQNIAGPILENKFLSHFKELW
jgi:hypothetical protein